MKLYKIKELEWVEVVPAEYYRAETEHYYFTINLYRGILWNAGINYSILSLEDGKKQAQILYNKTVIVHLDEVVI